MNKKHTRFPISSTPCPQRKTQHLSDIFENETFSPIKQPVLVKEPAKAHLQPVSKSSRTCAKIDALMLKKRRCATTMKEPTSKAVLKELGLTGETARNMLSKSRNMYNMYPEPIVLDSDEEEEMLISTNSKQKMPKKKNTLIKSAAKLDKVITFNNKERIYEKPSKNPKPVRSRSTKPGVSKIVRQVQCPTQPQSCKDKILIQKQTSASVIICSDDESICTEGPVSDNLFDTQKRRLLNVPISDDEIENVIQWTARRLQNVKSKAISATTIEDSDNSEGVKSENIDNKNAGIKKNKENLTADSNSRDSKKKHPTTDNNFPKECFSRFKNVVFKHNKNSGGIVANCLTTDKLNFGYVEVEQGKVFTGHHSNVTFVLLEGQVKASLQSTTQHMVAGDILHIGSDSVYQFSNTSLSHARLLYVKERLS